MRRIEIEHSTTYDYPEPVQFLKHRLLVRPREGHDIRIESSRLDIATLALLDAINRKLVDDIAYEVRELVGVQSPAEDARAAPGLLPRRGPAVHRGLPLLRARRPFVSGYLLSSAAVKDVASTHAWSEVYLPAGGWRGFDSTSAQHVGREHVAVAVHRHPQAIPPVSGAYLAPEKPRPVMRVEVRATQL